MSRKQLSFNSKCKFIHVLGLKKSQRPLKTFVMYCLFRGVYAKELKIKLFFLFLLKMVFRGLIQRHVA